MRRSVVSALCGLAISVAALGTPAWGAARSPRGHAAGVMNVRDEGSLSFVTDSATLIVDEGHVSGTIPGKARVNFTYDGSPTVTAQFTIRGSSGSITGHARCRLSSPTTPAPSFRGILTITAGSGHYARAHGSGELFGIFHRRGYGLVVQAIGKLRY